MEIGAKYSDENAQKPRPYRVLSLDGGGTRGVYTAAFLDHLLNQWAKRSGRKELDLGLSFDLIVGTSTGAIVGCAAAIGAPMNRVVELYTEHGPSIFPHRIKGTMSAIFRAFTFGHYVKRGDAALKAALGTILKDITMRDVFEKRGISMSIPSVKMSTHRAYVFKKTPNSGVRDDEFKLSDVCLASSAAPVYRSLAAIEDQQNKIGGKQVFADGGLWANNPILVGLVDALANADPDQPIEIYSLGTCPRPEGELISEAKVHRGLFGWKLGADVAPVSISAQEFAYDNMARMLASEVSRHGRSVRRVRFPNQDVPASMMDYLALDDAREKAMNRLIQQAHTDADMTLSACDDRNNTDGVMIMRLLNSIPEINSKHTLYTPPALSLSLPE